MNVEKKEEIPKKGDTLGEDTVIDTEKVNKKTNRPITNKIAEFQEDD